MGDRQNRAARNYALGDRGHVSIFGQLNNMFSWKKDCCIEYEIEVDEDTGESSLNI